jgi:hypothetical protein
MTAARGLAAVCVTSVILGTTGAWASFTNAATTSVSPAGYSTLTLSAPVLTCDPGGLLHTTAASPSPATTNR